MAALSLFASAAPAAAQTPPPDPLSQLLPNLLAPLQPILNQLAPSQPAAHGPVSQPGPGGAGGGGGGGGGGYTGPQSFPANPEYHCNGTPAPLVFKRGPARDTQPLLDAARKLAGAGPLQPTLDRIAAPFPVAGMAHYRDDWGEPRSTPCPHIHQGNDIFADFGVPFVAPEAGTIARFGFEPVGGNAVYFAGDDGYGFYGAHLQTIAGGLRVGQHVAAGTPLGTVGNTGDAMGGTPHLHFQLYAPGHEWSSPEDPKFWLDAQLDSAIRNAGGVVPDLATLEAGGAQGVNAGNLVSSLLTSGGHIISQPTVPVLLFVLLLVSTLVVSQTRTFKVAADVRRSRSGVARATLTEAPLARRPGHGQRASAAAPAAAEKETIRPAWALAAEAARAAKEAEPPGPSVISRAASSVGEGWSKFPDLMSRVAAPPKPKGGKGEPGASLGSRGASHTSTKKDQRSPGWRPR